MNIDALLAKSCLLVASAEKSSGQPFDYFSPFVLACASADVGKEYIPSVISERLKSSFGWDVGADFVQLFEASFLRDSFLEKRSDKYIWAPKVGNGRAEADKSEIAHLGSTYYEYANSVFPLLVSGLSEADLLEDLATALVQNSLFSIKSISEFSDDNDGEMGNTFEVLVGRGATLNILAARFIRHVKNMILKPLTRW